MHGSVLRKLSVMALCMHAQSLQSCLTLQTLWTVPARPFCPWDFPGKNIGVGSCALLQGIFPTQGSNPLLLLWQAGSLPLALALLRKKPELSHKGVLLAISLHTPSIYLDQEIPQEAIIDMLFLQRDSWDYLRNVLRHLLLRDLTLVSS